MTLLGSGTPNLWCARGFLVVTGKISQEERKTFLTLTFPAQKDTLLGACYNYEAKNAWWHMEGVESDESQ